MSDGPAAADHLSLDELAELEEGIAANADALRRHVDGCSLCRERAGQLNASRALLSTLPADPMPADVAARIDAALAAEPAPPPALGGTIVPLHGRRAWMRGPNVAAAAAGVAVLALGAALVVGHAGSKSNGAAKHANPTGAAGPNVAAAPRPTGLKQFQTGHDYTATTYRRYVTGLLLNNPPPFPTPHPLAGAAPSASPSQPTSFTRDDLRDPANVYACAALLDSRPVTPIAIDYSTYDARPAAILVLPRLSNPTGELDVWVIRTTCGAGMTDFKFFRMPRPSGL
ncbi:MAG: hypothetical protein JO079_00340 [Frankiaceae bacterium]|nr:hypothetical protein [Frankiaceae bacterium]MBV9369717.1 hypothetical protein [Frankiales bacterium]